MKLRRLTVGARPVFTNIEMRMNIPDEVSDHPIVELLRTCATDMIIIANDLASYNVEQARGDDLHNSITIIMHQEGLDIQGSIDFLAKYHDRVAETFLTTQVDLPSFGPAIDADLRQYVDGMATWVTGNYWWQFESHRYFGSKGLEIMKSGKVQLSPKELPPPGIYMNMPA